MIRITRAQPKEWGDARTSLKIVSEKKFWADRVMELGPLAEESEAIIQDELIATADPSKPRIEPGSIPAKFIYDEVQRRTALAEGFKAYYLNVPGKGMQSALTPNMQITIRHKDSRLSPTVAMRLSVLNRGFSKNFTTRPTNRKALRFAVRKQGEWKAHFERVSHTVKKGAGRTEFFDKALRSIQHLWRKRTAQMQSRLGREIGREFRKR